MKHTPGKWTVYEEGTVGEFSVIAIPTPEDGGDIIYEAQIIYEFFVTLRHKKRVFAVPYIIHGSQPLP